MISRHYNRWVKLLEVLKQLDDERFIVKASSGPRYIVGCRNTIKKSNLKNGVRVSLDMTTLTIMRILPREVDPLVYNMTTFEPGEISFNGIGGLTEQVRELREVIELPLKIQSFYESRHQTTKRGFVIWPSWYR